MALPFEMFEGRTNDELAAAIANLMLREQAQVVVVGMPYNADGTVSNQSQLTEVFITVLTRRLPEGVRIERLSEYLSTHDAESKLAGHFTRQQKRQRVDALAAARILQDWVDGRRG